MSDTPDFFGLFSDPRPGESRPPLALMGLREAIRTSGIPLSYPAAIRLALRGRLKTVKVGGRRMTTPDAIRECVRESSKLPERVPTARGNAARRRARHRRLVARS